MLKLLYIKTAPSSSDNDIIFFRVPLNLIDSAFKIENSVRNNTIFSVTHLFFSILNKVNMLGLIVNF